MLSKKNKGQGALEYLLILGGAILVAVVVIVIISSTRTTTSDAAQDSTEAYTTMIDQTIVPPIITQVSCSTSDVNVTFSPSVTKGVDEHCLVIDDSLETSSCTADASPLEYTTTLTEGTYSISLVAKKGDNYSAISRPSFSCVVE